MIPKKVKDLLEGQEPVPVPKTDKVKEAEDNAAIAEANLRSITANNEAGKITGLYETQEALELKETELSDKEAKLEQREESIVEKESELEEREAIIQERVKLMADLEKREAALVKDRKAYDADYAKAMANIETRMVAIEAAEKEIKNKRGDY